MSAATDPKLEADLATVRKARIFFSHHSVGENILDGIRQLSAGSGMPQIAVAELQQAATTAGPALLHGSGGRNKDPASKIAFFDATLRGNRTLRPDLAFMKFCYVDFEPSTNVEALFAQYQHALTALKREFPGVRFAHVTVPLTPRQTDVKSMVRRWLGLQVWGDASNAKRHEFNERLTRAFPSDPLFDLAGVESTRPDGTQARFEFEGKRVPSLVPAYTDDGGHLNALGQRAAGAAAIRFLAAALVGRSASEPQRQ